MQWLFVYVVGFVQCVVVGFYFGGGGLGEDDWDGVLFGVFFVGVFEVLVFVGQEIVVGDQVDVYCGQFVFGQGVY